MWRGTSVPGLPSICPTILEGRSMAAEIIVALTTQTVQSLQLLKKCVERQSVDAGVRQGLDGASEGRTPWKTISLGHRTSEWMWALSMCKARSSCRDPKWRTKARDPIRKNVNLESHDLAVMITILKLGCVATRASDIANVVHAATIKSSH